VDTGRQGARHAEPYGSHASYLDLMQVSFNTAGEKAWGIGGNLDFNVVGIPGLTAGAVYADGHDRIDYTTGAPMPDRSESDVRADYAFAKGTMLEGLVATIRYSWTWRRRWVPSFAPTSTSCPSRSMRPVSVSCLCDHDAVIEPSGRWL
jgi:hypothetical protein